MRRGAPGEGRRHLAPPFPHRQTVVGNPNNAYSADLLPPAGNMMTGRFRGFLGFLLFPLARFLLGPFGMARPHPCPSPGWEGSPSAARIRFRAATTSFFPGSEMPLALQLSAQLRQPGIQSKGRATIGLPVARSQSKTPAGQKLRHSKSRRHTWESMVGNQGNRSRRLRIVGTAFSPKMTRNRSPKGSAQRRLSLGLPPSSTLARRRSEIPSFAAPCISGAAVRS